VAEAPTNTLSFILTTSPDTTGISLSTAFTNFLGLDAHDASALIDYEKRGKAFHTEDLYTTGATVFSSGSEADGFFVVLSGSVVILLNERSEGDDSIHSAAGVKHVKRRNVLESGQISRVLSVGTVFGFVDFVLKRPRQFTVVAWRDALVAKCHRSGLDELKRENTDLERIVDKVLLLCSVVELAAARD
jgi:CRP-like cAMP-binding protein